MADKNLIQKSSAAKQAKANPNISTTKAKGGTPTTREVPKKEKKKKEPSKFWTNFSAKIKNRKLFITTVVMLSVFVLTLSIFIGVFIGERRTANKVYAYEQKATTTVGYSAEYLGKVERNLPSEVSDGGLVRNGTISAYPRYGYTSSYDDTQKRAVISESWTLCSTDTRIGTDGYPVGTYNSMDSEGNLYLNGVPTTSAINHLYKHTAADSMYYGKVSDDEPAVVKRVSFRPRSYGRYYNVTGLYAPAGEVIKIQISKVDMDSIPADNTGGKLEVHIGQALYNTKANNIWPARAINRMPVILNTMVIRPSSPQVEYDEEKQVYTAYVGSFLGGPIYIQHVSKPITVTISGAVNYSHFILGYTTKEEFTANAKTSVPFFDLEVWDSGVLHSGPKNQAARFSYEDLYKAAIFWEKVSLVSTQRVNQGVVFLYDPFVAAGAAVAFPGQGSVNCPASWMASSLNYNQLVTSGAWGNMHEYNHNFQGYGVGDTGEVTNNALNLVEYSLFTKISSARQISNYGGAGLGGWNSYTSATWALQRVNQNAITSTSGLAVYATLLHNLGQDAFMKSASGGGNQYITNWSNVTHQDMSYYTNLVSTYATNTSPSTLHAQQSAYPMFVPVSCVYQTGRSYMYDNEKRYITTMQPYVIPYGEVCEVDLSPYTTNDGGQYLGGSIVMPAGFKYKIKKIDTSRLNGKLTKTQYDESTQTYVYNFKPNKRLNSGKIIVTLEITNESNYAPGTTEIFDVQDVDLVLEFEQSHEMKKSILQRTTYTYAPGTVYTSATDAYANNYSGYISKVDTDSTNPVQNSNTDIWYYPKNDTTEGHDPKYKAPENSIAEVRGKFFINEDGRYRIAMRGRLNCALYISLDNGKTYECKATITSGTTANFRDTDPSSYVDLDLKANSWVYFKEVMIVETDTTTSFIGLGMRAWTVPSFTMRTEIVDGKEVVRYYNAANQEVSEEEANNAQPIEPRNMTNSYATAYRASYESIVRDFKSEYLYTRRYNYSFSNTTTFDTKQSLVETNYKPWTLASNRGPFDIDNLFDDSTDTYIHSVQNSIISETNPIEITASMGEKISANWILLNGYSSATLPRAFKLHGSLDNKTYFEMSVSAISESGGNMNIALDKVYEFKFYRLVVTRTNNGYFAASKLTFSINLNLPNGKHLSPDDASVVFKGNWKAESRNSYFGHLYTASKRTESVTLTFTGSRFAILSSTYVGDNYDVYVDGKKLDSVIIRDITGDMAIRYVSPGLKDGKHTVKIVCTGKASIDSFVIW